MKKFLAFAACAAVAATSLFSCQKETLGVRQTEENGSVHFVINACQDNTKTYIVKDGDSWAPKWSKGDQIGIFFADSTIVKEAAVHGTLTNTANDGELAVFEGDVTKTKGSELYAFYPAECYYGGYADGTAGLNIGDDDNDYKQSPLKNSFDPDCDILVSDRTAYSLSGSTASIENMKMARLLSVLKVDLNSDFESVKGEKVQSFKMTATGAVLSGRASYSFSEKTIKTYNVKKNYLWAVYEEGQEPEINTDGEKSVFLMVAPTTIAKSTGITVEIETENYEITKSFTLTAAMDFPQGKMAVLNLSIAEGDCTSKSAPKTLPYEESFTGSTFGRFTIENKTLPEELTYVWSADDKYVKASGSKYDTSTKETVLYTTESWLVSPKINTTSTAGLAVTFDHALNYLGENAASDFIKLYVREYDGETAGDWVEQTIKAYPTGSSWDFVTNTTSLSSYQNKIIQVAFKYSSTTECAPNWEIKNFSISTPPATTISFASASLTMKAGDNVSNVATTNSPATVSYESSDSNVAKVDASGNVTAVANGTCTITASVEAKEGFAAAKATCEVTVSSDSQWTYTVSDDSQAFTSSESITINGAVFEIVMGEKVGDPTTNGEVTSSSKVKCWKWGNNKSNYWKSYTIKTDYFSSKKVKSVAIKFWNNGSKSATMTVDQGETNIGSKTATFGQTWTELVADTNVGTEGTLLIKYEVDQASSISSITVTYSD